MTELGPLPEEWEVVKLGEVCKVDWGNTSLTKKLYTANGYPAFSAAGNDGFLDFYEHDGEAVILSAIGARSGKCFYASGKWTAIKNTIVIKSNNETKINLLFLYFFVNNENYWHKSGSGQPFISIGVAQKQKLPLPPLPEQQKMAAVLSAVQEAKEKT
ncbi:MAG TPA: restriction endonuclease subunit S, partial [Paludibacteraceae bacterium]|nr:restriction endonuclease subunit S [Paludibacteraceae bacterium]